MSTIEEGKQFLQSNGADPILINKLTKYKYKLNYPRGDHYRPSHNNSRVFTFNDGVKLTIEIYLSNGWTEINSSIVLENTNKTLIYSFDNDDKSVEGSPDNFPKYLIEFINKIDYDMLFRLI